MRASRFCAERSNRQNIAAMIAAVPAPTSVSTTAKPTTIFAETRSGSAATPWPCGCSCPCGFGLVASMRERLLESGVVHGQERPVGEVAEVDAEQEAADRDRDGQVGRMDDEVAAREGRQDHPREVDEAHEDDERRGGRQEARVPVRPPREEQQERQDELEDQHREPDGAPAPAEARE